MNSNTSSASKFRNLLNDSRTLGVLLIFCTLISLLLSNIKGMGAEYIALWDKEIPGFHRLHLPHTLLHFINDGLMTIFFFHVAMDIKREATVGELASRSRMMLPLGAAIFGVAFPALIFTFINKGTPYINGWAIPTATDIAFSLGMISLLGKAVPYFMKVFLTALAIIDDLCAILIIALFYGTTLHFSWIVGAIIISVVIFFVNRKIHNKLGTVLMLILGVALWYCMYRSGIHASFAGVILAFLLPVNKLASLEVKLNIPVNLFIIPVFALANTSIIITQASISSLGSGLSLGIILGLFVGKPLGITMGVYFLTKSHLAKLAKSIDWIQFIGVGILAGIGFTMSIFISTLSFPEHNLLQDTAKLSVLIASALAMVVGYVWLKVYSKVKKE